MKKIPIAVLTACFMILGGVLNAQEYENDPLNAVVRIETVSTVPNFLMPWQNRAPQSSSGSGVVIEGNQILTNAHNVADSTMITVRKQNEDTLFVAKVKFVDHECDLALLTVDDHAFFSDITPMEFAETPPPQSMVIAAGFPLGGDGLSITQGIISRIENSRYTHSYKRLLAAQIDASINPGNSGGPVFFEGKIVGIAFQISRRGEGLGYMIPYDIISHFLEDIQDGKVDGFGELDFLYMPLDNPDTRAYLKMKPEQTGILVRKVFTETGNNVLQAGDVILSIDGKKIANNGNIRLADGQPRDFSTVIAARQIGERVKLEVLRNGKRLNTRMSVQKLHEKVEPYLYDRHPEYYIVGGLVFTRLTYSYLETFGDDYPPIEMLEKFNEVKDSPDDNVVILERVLGDEVNVGYQLLQSEVLVSINGKKVHNLREVAEMVETCKDDYITFEFEGDLPVTLNAEKAREATPRILERYRIQSDRHFESTTINPETDPQSVLETISLVDHIKSDTKRGFKFSEDGKTLMSAPPEVKHYSIPEGITCIGEAAFFICEELYDIKIPNTVTTIEDGAFHRCDLEQITIPDSVTRIGNPAKTIKDKGTTDYTNGVFYCCDSLASVFIPNSVTTIGDGVFTGARLIKVSDDNPLFYNDPKGALIERKTGKLIHVPVDLTGHYTIPEEVTSIGYEAFYGCSSLKSLSIPDSVTSIGDSAFYGCEGLEEVSISNNVARIGTGALSGIKTVVIADDHPVFRKDPAGVLIERYSHKLIYAPPSLSGDYAIPDDVTEIGEDAFAQCKSLNSISIPDGVCKIGDYAFFLCGSLCSITIPESVTTIGKSAFHGCRSLTHVKIPNSVTYIGKVAFLGCESLKDITLSDNISSIEDETFCSCPSLQKIAIPNGVTRIGRSAFSNCFSLASIVLPNSLTDIGDYAFHQCSLLSLENADSFLSSDVGKKFAGIGVIKVSPDNPVFYNDPHGALLERNTHKLVHVPSTISGHYSIPEVVTVIGDFAFAYCEQLNSVAIPNSVTSIEEYAFAYCKSMNNIAIPTSVTSIWKCAFFSAGCEWQVARDFPKLYNYRH